MEKKIESERKLIEATKTPITRERMQEDFVALGLTSGMCLMMHSSLKSIGWVPGGAQLVIEALMEILGADGTLMTPVHSTHLTDPKTWEAPPVPEAWHETIRNGFPGFNPATTPSRGMGIISETLRKWPGAVRSNHPHTSFCAVGPLAQSLMADHALSSPMGKRSPLQKLVNAEGTTLLLGVGFGNNTCFHLAEESLVNPPRLIEGAPILVDGKAQWTNFDSIDYDDEDFVRCGEAFQGTGKLEKGNVGNADCLLFSTKTAVNFAIDWLRQNR
jgi:aminoglycoside 3-N-acetyltransferase